MQFSFTPEEEAFRAHVREYLRGQMPQAVPQAPSPFSDEDYYSLARQVRLGLGRRGRSPRASAGATGAPPRSWLTLGWPGAGGSPVKDLILLEEMAYFGVPRASDYGTHLAGRLIASHGSQAQKEAHLGPLARGEEWWCTGFTEPMAGSDLAAIRTRAERSGDGYVLTGQKDYGEWAHESGWCHLLARTDPNTTGSSGLTCFMLDMRSSGIFLNPFVSMTGRTLCEIFLDGVMVPDESALGVVGGGWEIVREFLDGSRSGIEFSGWARRIQDSLVANALSMWHKGGDITRHKLAEAAMDIQVARLLSYRTARGWGEGGVSSPDISLAKLFGSEMCQRVASMAMGVAGLSGQLARGQPWSSLTVAVQEFFLETMAGTIYSGSSEIQRDIIASRGLGLPGWEGITD